MTTDISLQESTEPIVYNLELLRNRNDAIAADNSCIHVYCDCAVFPRQPMFGIGTCIVFDGSMIIDCTLAPKTSKTMSCAYSEMKALSFAYEQLGAFLRQPEIECRSALVYSDISQIHSFIEKGRHANNPLKREIARHDQLVMSIGTPDTKIATVPISPDEQRANPFYLASHHAARCAALNYNLLRYLRPMMTELTQQSIRNIEVCKTQVDVTKNFWLIG